MAVNAPDAAGSPTIIMQEEKKMSTGKKKGKTRRTSKYDDMSFQELCSLEPKEVLAFLKGLWGQGVEEIEELSPGEQTLFRIVEAAFETWERQQPRD